MRAADAAALTEVTHETLVARAGTAVAHRALLLLGGAYGRRVTVVVGKGSNGADGRVAAEYLTRRGARVTVVGAADAPSALPPCDLVIDGAYGTGFHGAYDAPVVAPGTPVLAIDIASGVDADTGRASGAATRATHTVTFAALKPGLLQGDGPGLCGQVSLIEDADIAALLPARPRQANKWTNAVGIAAGSVGMEGAAILCARGALAAGSGMVRLGSPGNPPAPWPEEVVRLRLPEAGWAAPFLEAAAKCRAVVVGPGLGTDPATMEEIRAVIAGAPVPVVIDADAITALGDMPDARALLATCSEPRILTPHDGEYGRLAGSPPGDDRLAAARDLAGRIGAIVLLKGPLTAVAAVESSPPDVLLASSGVPALATAGSGDVLTGVIAAFVARGVTAHGAAALAAHVHGRAASLGRPAGLVAGDLPDLIAQWLSTGPDHG
jgi:NAD(P)H-hydrate epimerase